ncbi:MAG: phenylalanine--tRNA ligase beta subunit-related protein, partial [Acidimicrobiia bacterium]
MRAPLSWLCDFAPFDDPPAVLAAALDGLGLVVEGLVEVGEGVRGVVVAEVLGVRPHPGADRLTLVDVDLGGGTVVEVVCGARNLTAGNRVPYAAIGAGLAGGLQIERRRIRGVISEGMLCSARELGIGDDHEGILHLQADAELGQDVTELLGLGDIVFDLDVTPNRPDALCVAGVARDLAAVLGLPFHIPESAVAAAAGGRSADSKVSLVVEAPERCPRYVARIGRVRIGPSPAWLARRLTLAGMRPISNVVDVTNYVLLERGQPLH